MINFIQKTEPHHLDACAQFSLAMILDIPVEEVAHDMGTWDGVVLNAIEKFLERKGYWDGDLGKEGEPVNLSKRGMLIIQNGIAGHAVAFEDNVIYDPNGKIFLSVGQLCLDYTLTDEDGRTWTPRAVLNIEPVKTREWEVGKKKEEEAI